MHTLRLFISLVFLFLTSFIPNLFAQITFGSEGEPAKAGIMELKTISPGIITGAIDENNKTTESGGLLLPRVKLQNILTLAPFLTDAEANADKQKIKHAGLMVYNINNSVGIATDPKKVFKEGIYTWDGERWSMLVREEFKFFHMPTFNLDVTERGTFTVNLYSIYQEHFTANRSGASTFPSLIKNPSARSNFIGTFKKGELDFFVTYYDQSVLKDVSVDNAGVMKYTVDPNPPFNPFSYINIVFVVK